MSQSKILKKTGPPSAPRSAGLEGPWARVSHPDNAGEQADYSIQPNHPLSLLGWPYVNIMVHLNLVPVWKKRAWFLEAAQREGG